jgi:hypothetical protein
MINQKLQESLQQFINKPCSFFVTRHQKDFNNETDLVYFSGIVTEISQHGVFYTSFRNRNLNFINFIHLISINEEEIITEKKESQPKVAIPETIEDAEKLLENI